MAQLYLGLNSGTSMDGIDAALFDLENSVQLIAGLTYPAPQETINALWDIIKKDNINDRRIPMLDEQLGSLFAQAALAVLKDAKIKPNEVIAIGSHGQNISHHPNDKKPYTLQIGDPQIIANETGITTVGQFRIADIAAGGQGAPLSPLLHQHLFKSNHARAIVNIGGIANVSFICPHKNITGFDTGPGNGLLDAYIKQQLQQNYDKDGAWAASGKTDYELLKHLLDDPYFTKPAPKSTGKEYFNLDWLMPYLSEQTPNNVQATLLQLTVHSILNAIDEYGDIDEIIVCGGGVHNQYLLAQLKAQAIQKVCSSADYDINPDYLESLLFAWLAKERLSNIEFDMSQITGAVGPVLLGEVYLPE